MSDEIDRFFDSRARNLTLLREDADNEAMRHDLIVRPVLTSPYALGWHGAEVVPQKNIRIPDGVRQSYVWRGARPHKRRPDLLLVPYGQHRAVAVVEEKRRQSGLSRLAEYLGQVKEYQYLHNTVWGLLTDGEKWLLQRNHEVYLECNSLAELKRRLPDLRECIGRDAVVGRLLTYGTTDLVISRPSASIVIIVSLGRYARVTDLKTFLQRPSIAGCDLMLHQFTSVKKRLIEISDGVTDDDLRVLLEYLYREGFANVTMATVVYAQMVLSQPADPTYLGRYSELLPEWIAAYSHLEHYCSEVASNVVTLLRLLNVFNALSWSPPVSDVPAGEVFARVSRRTLSADRRSS